MSASAKQVNLFPVMFRDSKIASDMRLGRTKLSYGLVYGLAPHFHDKVVAAVRGSGYFVVSFDESLNKVSQAQQMDIAVISWNNLSNQVEPHYLSSAFLGHARASDLLKAFQSELKDFDLRNLLQLSMDGPNVNWAFFGELQKFIRSSFGDQAPCVLDIGSCGLHVVHNSIKQALNSCSWTVIPFLRSCYWVFKDVPARRSDFFRFNKPENPTGNPQPKPELPLKFCAVRWLENEPVIDRAVAILPCLQKFVEGVATEKIKIKSKSYATVKKNLDDPLLRAKLAFTGYVVKQITPFLRDYQSEAPMAPFLYSDLSAVIRDMMTLFVKPEVIEAAKSVSDVNLSDDKNLLSLSKLKCGFAVKGELQKLSLSDDETREFKSECRKILVSVCTYLVQKSPLKYRLCRAITFCNPSLIAKYASVCVARLNSALELFSSNNGISSDMCDRVAREFLRLTKQEDFLDLCKQYKRDSQRLDHFWRDLLQTDENYKNLFDFLKMVLILSHGQAFIERGFSINKECVVENQLPKSLIAQRQVYDGLRSAGGLAKLVIDKEMIKSFRNARDRYGEALKKQKEEEDQDKATAAQKRALRDQIAELKAKRAKLVSEKATELSLLNDQITALMSSV